MIVRPAKPDDVKDLIKLTEMGEKNMTTLPKDEAQWLQLVEFSQASFATLPQGSPKSAAYLLVLEEDSGEVVGTSAIYTPIGDERPFYNFKITHVSNVSFSREMKVETDLLHLMNDYDGAAEVGTLLLRKEFRGGGRGRLLALARYLLLASYPEAFPERIVAELRGWRGEDDSENVFWQSIGHHFFKIPFEEADALSMQDKAFIADLMPRVPIYTCLISEQARAAIGRPHKFAVPAQKLLLNEGFYYNKAIDIFDGGPLLEARKQDIKTVRECRTETVTDHDYSGLTNCMVAHADGGNFMASYAAKRDGVLAISSHFSKQSKQGNGDSLLVTGANS